MQVLAGSMAGNIVGGLAIMVWGIVAFEDLFVNARLMTPNREPARQRQFRIGFAVCGAITMAASAPWYTLVFVALALIDATRLIGRRRRKLYWRTAILDTLANHDGPLSSMELTERINMGHPGALYLDLARLESEGKIKSDWEADDPDANKENQTSTGHGRRRLYRLA